MSHLAFENLRSAPLADFTHSFDVGVHWILSEETQSLAHLIDLACGKTAPKRGKVRLNDAGVSTPAARTHVAALPAQLSLPRVGVSTLIASVLALKGNSGSPADLLATWDLAAWERLRCDQLAEGAARALALILALSTPRIGVLALYDPLSLGLSPDRLRTAIENQTAAGAVVLIALPTVALQAPVGFPSSSQWVMRKGQLLSPAQLKDTASPPARIKLHVHCTGMRALAERLSADVRVATLAFDVAAAPHLLEITGNSPGGLAAALSDAALKVPCEITHIAMKPAPNAGDQAA